MADKEMGQILKELGIEVVEQKLQMRSSIGLPKEEKKALNSSTVPKAVLRYKNRPQVKKRQVSRVTPLLTPHLNKAQALNSATVPKAVLRKNRPQVPRPLTGPATPKIQLTGPATPKIPLTGPATPKIQLTGPATPKIPLTGPATPKIPLTGPATPKIPLTGPATPKIPLTGPATPKIPLTAATSQSQSQNPGPSSSQTASRSCSQGAPGNDGLVCCDVWVEMGPSERAKLQIPDNLDVRRVVKVYLPHKEKNELVDSMTPFKLKGFL